MLLLLLLIFFPSFLTLMFANSALYRYPTYDLSSGNFKCDLFYYLWEEKLTSSMVKGQFSCAFLCVGSRVFWLRWSLSLWVVGHWQRQSYWKAFCKCHIPLFQSLGKLSLHIWWLKRILSIYIICGTFSVSFQSHVKALLVCTVVSVSLSMSKTPITVTVNLYSVELTANEVV